MQRFGKSTEVQTIIFDRSKWTIGEAKKWLRNHNYKVPAVDTTDDYHRFRQSPPFRFKKGTFRTIEFGKQGIKAVIAVSRKSQSTPNPPSKQISRVPSMLADLADCVSIELEHKGEMRFAKSNGSFALCTTKSGTELWIVARKGSKRVQADDEKIENLYERFTGFEADPVGKLVLIPEVRLSRFDRAMAIVYRSDKFGRTKKDYIHSFNAYPTVSVDRPNKPRIVALRGGRIRVTAEGIKG